jgi:hypothetical protein
VTQGKAPPPLGAATVVVTDDGHLAVASDPDRDRIVIADLVSASHPKTEVALHADDEPGRLVLDATHAHVVLRRAGVVASIDLATGGVRERRAVCGAPQGSRAMARRST